MYGNIERAKINTITFLPFHFQYFISKKILKTIERKEDQHTLFSHFFNSFFLPISYTRNEEPTPTSTRPRNGQMAAEEMNEMDVLEKFFYSHLEFHPRRFDE